LIGDFLDRQDNGWTESIYFTWINFLCKSTGGSSSPKFYFKGY